MQVPSIFCLFPLPLLFFFVQLIPVQGQNTNSDISNWYLEERFIIADQNDDALLSRNELEVFSDEFCYYLADRHFALTDKNQDGYLSYNEITQRKKTEYIYRNNLERKELRALGSQYPMLAQADISYLKSNPELVESLFANLVWLCENANLAEKLYNDNMWSNRHPEVMLALHRNLRWMVANPNDARDLYRDRSTTQRLPELLSWRADHKDFLRRHTLLDRLYELEFIPASVRYR